MGLVLIELDGMDSDCGYLILNISVIDNGYCFEFWICQDLDLSGFGSLRIWISQDSNLSGFRSLRIWITQDSDFNVFLG